MNGSTKAACALVMCETESFVRQMGQAFGRGQISRALRWFALWIVPPVPYRTKSQNLAWPWHVLLSIAAAAGTFVLEPATAPAQCCGMGSPGYAPGASCCGSPCCGSPCGGSPCGGSPYCGSPLSFGPPGCRCPPSCCRPAGCCGSRCSCGCGGPRFSLGIFPGGNCCPGYAPACGSTCGPACGLACGPSCGPACGAPTCNGCGPACGCPGVSSPCGIAGGYPMQTFETPAAPQPTSSNKAGPSTIIEPTETSPEGPPTPIKKQSAPPATGTQFERQPQGSLDAAASLDVTQTSAEPAGLCEKRFFRQSASAGFRTRVLVPGSGRLVSRAVVAKSPASCDFMQPRAFARTD